MKNRLDSLKEKIKKLLSGLADVFRDYPLTMAMILVAALSSAILLHIDHKDSMKEYCEMVMQFAFWMAAQCFVIEEIFRKKLIPKICGIVFAILYASAFDYINFTKKVTVFGINLEIIKEIHLKVCVVYGVLLFAAVIFHLFKRLKEDFEAYCTGSFLTLLKSYVIYGLFAAGLAVILYIFNELIFDTGDLIECSEAFLATGFIAAMTIRALSSEHEKPGRFARICVMYALLPMLLIAFAIIYIYMIKIFVLNEIPSNSVFRILSGLFSVGVPIWTMAHVMGNDVKGLKKISFIVPYVFIPFIFLQCWSLGIRIKQYGLTESRYSGIILIIVEVLYFIVYTIGRIIKKDLIFIMLFVLMILAPVCAFVPHICYDDAVIDSQMKRIKNIISMENISPSDGRQLISAYNEIKNTGYKGKKTAETAFSESEKKIIQEHRNDPDYSYSSTAYMSDDRALADLDISAYGRISETGFIHWEYGDINDRPYDLEFSTLSDNSPVYTINLEGLAKSAVSQYEAGKEYEFELGNYRLMKIDDKNDLYIKEITVIYNEEEPEEMEIKISGYVLERN